LECDSSASLARNRNCGPPRRAAPAHIGDSPPPRDRPDDNRCRRGNRVPLRQHDSGKAPPPSACALDLAEISDEMLEMPAVNWPDRARRSSRRAPRPHHQRGDHGLCAVRKRRSLRNGETPAPLHESCDRAFPIGGVAWIRPSGIDSATPVSSAGRPRLGAQAPRHPTSRRPIPVSSVPRPLVEQPAAAAAAPPLVLALAYTRRLLGLAAAPMREDRPITRPEAEDELRQPRR